MVDLPVYVHIHSLDPAWSPPARVSLHDLDAEAARLTGDEVEVAACGSADEGRTLVDRLGLHVLDVFLAECFDGSLARQFRGENVRLDRR